MELYLIRHTTPDVEKGICYGQTDLTLAESFSAELDRVKEHLPAKFDAVFSSPLLRCATLAETLHDQPVFDDRLKEMDFGNWEMKPWNKIVKEEIDPWMADFVNVEVPGGESFAQVINRSEAALEDIIERGGEQVAIVSHAGVVRALLGHCLSMNPKHFFRLNVDYGGVSRVSVNKGYYTVKYVNR